LLDGINLVISGEINAGIDKKYWIKTEHHDGGKMDD